MRTSVSAIVLAAGDRAIESAFEAWAARHHVRTSYCRDAFDLCTLLLTSESPPPALVLVATGRVPADELCVLGYVRRVWTQCALLAVAHHADAPSAHEGVVEFQTLSVRALTDLLDACAPDELVRAARRPPVSRVRSAAPRQPLPLPAARENDPARSRSTPAAAAPASVAPAARPRDAAPEARHVEESRLTEAELAALLQDPEA